MRRQDDFYVQRQVVRKSQSQTTPSFQNFTLIDVPNVFRQQVTGKKTFVKILTVFALSATNFTNTVRNIGSVFPHAQLQLIRRSIAL